jgi:hypothetical protein
LEQEADGIGPVAANFRLVCTVGHGHCHRFHLSGASLRVKPARSAVFLDYPEIQAAGRSLFYQAARHFSKKLSSYSLPRAMRGHVQIIEESAECRMVVREYARESHQLPAGFRKDCEKRLAVYFRESRLPQGGALRVDVMIEIVAGQNPTVRGTPAFSVQMRDGCGVVLGGVAQGHHCEPNFRLNPTSRNGIAA